MTCIGGIRAVLAMSIVLLVLGPMIPANTWAITLNPSPDDVLPGSTYTCQTTGHGVTCQGNHPQSYSQFTGLTCGSDQLIETGSGSLRFTLFYDATGNATRWILHDDQNAGPDNTLSDPVTGKSVPFSEHETITFDFTTPGDLSTATDTITGQPYTITLPGSGVVLHDVGTIKATPDGQLVIHGPHDALTGNMAALCAALQ